MKAALAILLVLIGGFLIYEVLSGNASIILDTLNAKGKGVDLYPSTATNNGGGAGGAF